MNTCSYQYLIDHVNLNYSLQELREIARHGCVSGVASDLIYYSETNAFYDKWHEEIWTMLCEDCEDEGFSSVPDFISKHSGAQNIVSNETFKNHLCWYAVERIACLICFAEDLKERR